jgi:hypothetical protein
MIKSQILLDSQSPYGPARLTTYIITFPRIILAELNTHRVFSRNVASSRARPSWHVREDVWNNPFYPIYWGKKCKGMQADKGELTGIKRWLAEQVWRGLIYVNIGGQFLLDKLGLHKQHSNRVIEPYYYCTALVSSTEWYNFFELRNSEFAQPEFGYLANLMQTQYEDSVPVTRELHLPFAETVEADERSKMEISAGRCCTISYTDFGGQKDIGKDIERCHRLINDKHFSPAEHPAKASLNPTKKYGNFCGWVQFRKILGA